MRESAASGDESLKTIVDSELKKLVTRWTTSKPPLIPPRVDLPLAISQQLASRSEYTSRFDPFVLAVEHEALNRGKLSAPSDGGRAKFVRFNHLDDDLAPKGADSKAKQEAETQHLMKKLGMADLGLIREFDLCRFTHGYTRVSATPILNKRNKDMPVRLRLFDPLDNGKRPIYVMTQANEAIYVTLRALANGGRSMWCSCIGRVSGCRSLLVVGSGMIVTAGQDSPVKNVSCAEAMNLS